MTKYTITTDQNRALHVHVTGSPCASREALKTYFRFWYTAGESVEAVIDAEIELLDKGLTRDDFHVCSCCKRTS